MITEKTEFSKVIIVIETLMTLYITYRTLNFIDNIIATDYMGSLPYLTTLITVVWAAYGTSVSFYYNKAKTENSIKIKANMPENEEVKEENFNG